MTTKDDIKNWLKEAPKDATHMIVVCDTFDYCDYPVYTSEVDKTIDHYNIASMQKIMEVYNLSIDFNKQLNVRKAWNI